MTKEKWIDCTGDAVVGDRVKFTEAVFGGSYRKPKFLGEREIVADIVKDSYGADKQQHTFTLVVISASGERSDEVEKGATVRRKGRNLYRNGTQRMPWENEDDRKAARKEKHSRGDAARAARQERKDGAF